MIKVQIYIADKGSDKIWHGEIDLVNNSWLPSLLRNIDEFFDYLNDTYNKRRNGKIIDDIKEEGEEEKNHA